MDPDELTTILRRTLDDHRLSRSERRALREVIGELSPDEASLAVLRARAFELAADEIARPRAREVLAWLEDVVKVLVTLGTGQGTPPAAEAVFSPGDNCAHRVSALVAGARKSIDVCVYTITDDRISDPLIHAHRQGVSLRVLTDDEKQDDLGSDIRRLRDAGVPVATDRSEYRMHHKFALFDGRLLVTGSYNWTRSAAEHNQENLVVTEDPRLADAYAREFERLWSLYART